MTQRPHLWALVDRVGILPGHIDNTGAWCATTESVAEGLLDAMGFDAASEAAASASLRALDEQNRSRVIDPFAVEPLGEDGRQILIVEDDRSLRGGRMVTEAGTETELSCEGPIELPISEPGWYQIEVVDVDGRSHLQERVVHQPRCFAVDEILGADVDRFGIVANLYSLRSSVGGSGVGDLAALDELVRRAGEVGAAFVGVNPMHAVAYDRSEVSPYCPDSRVFRNPVYISLRDVPEFGACEAAQAAVDQMPDGTGPIDYDAVWTRRLGVLRLLHAEFEATGRRARRDEFATFCDARSETLKRYAEFMSRRVPNTTPGLHRYLQFETHRQLCLVAERARGQNMPLGLYADIAVGVAPWGADVHLFPDVFLPSLRIGAPPDAYAPDGQEWGVCPVHPARFGSAAGAYWRAVLQSAMQHAGLVRIDHAMGLARQYLVPRGEPPSRGAYVQFPTRELLGILALESHRHRTVVVGESLGTLPDDFLGVIHRAGMLSTQVVYFERDPDGSFRGTESYARDALAQLNTHDLPTLHGYVAGHDIDVRAELGLIDVADAMSKRTERRQDLDRLVGRLREEGIDHEDVAEGLHRFLGRTPARLVGVMFDDLAGELDAVNLPEAFERDYKPWTRRNRKTIGDVFASEVAQGMLKAVGRSIG